MNEEEEEKLIKNHDLDHNAILRAINKSRIARGYDMQLYRIHNGTYKRLFKLCCKYGNLQAAKGFYTLSGLEARAPKEGDKFDKGRVYPMRGGETQEADDIRQYADALRSACGNGHIPVAEWLYSLTYRRQTEYPDIIPGRDMYLFAACGGHYDLVKWIHENTNVKIDDIKYYYEPFTSACKKGSLPLAKWIYENVPGTDIREGADSPIRYAEENGHYDVVEWLLEMGAQPEPSSRFYPRYLEMLKVPIGQRISDYKERLAKRTEQIDKSINELADLITTRDKWNAELAALKEQLRADANQ